MSEFIVSARKYRPATFASVVGQQSITSTLKNAIERGQLAHAYLFCGPRGVGKTTCARIFAKAINCLNPRGSEACNECESCRAFNEGRSMNIHELDAASNNSVDDIRSLIEQVRIMPQIGKYSLFIIDEVHMLSSQAFNAFLKTLEEPPKHAVFILATTEKHKIIPTILSRCQVYDFNRIRVEDSVGYLKYIAEQEGVKFDEESLNLIAQKADGGMRDALSMFDKAVSFCNADLRYKEVAQTLNVLDYDTYFSITEQLLAGDYISALLRFDEVLSNGFSGQTFMAGLNNHMRDLLLAKGPAIKLIELTGTLLERYRRQAEQCDVEFLFGAISMLTEADGRIKQSSNQRLLVELSLMKIAGLGKKKNSGEAIEAEYPLPELPQGVIVPAGGGVAPSQQGSAAGGVAPSVAKEATAVQTTTQAASQEQQEGVAVQREPVVAVTQPSAEQSEQQSASGVASAERGASDAGNSASSEGAQSAESGARPAVTRRRAVGSGLSISSMMQGEVSATTEEEPSVPSVSEVQYDASSEEKIMAVRDRVVAAILEERPRFVVAFEQMQVEGHTIKVEVPSQTLYEEIMRSQTELLLMVARLAGINGTLDLQVSINEQIKASRPIKLEDRIKFMSEKNPHLLELKHALDLEYE
ncbi:MAG: DNA polymerase III subunit gamma/tau [Alistipes sp.]|nr:DNA polymerase III subunit gamma/tau [Alistipes sp.]